MQYWTNAFITSRCTVFETFGCRSAGHCIEWTHISLLHWRLLSFHSLKRLAPFTVPHLQEPRHCQLFDQCDPPTSALTLHHIASKWEALGKRQLSSISGELTFLSVLGYFGDIPQEKWIRQQQKRHTPICSASMIRVFRPRVSREKKAPQILPTCKGCGWTRFWTENPEIHRHGIDFPI